MKTVILPGFSPKNKTWVEEVKAELNSTIPCEVVYWKHWETGTTETGWIDTEARRISELIQDNTSIIAKSIGTAVAMEVVRKKRDLMDKLILCGIPTKDFQDGDDKRYDILKIFPSNRVLCIQNLEDNHGNFDEVEKFLHSVNPKLKIVSKPRSDHEYPYFEDFKNFLSKT